MGHQHTGSYKPGKQKGGGKTNFSKVNCKPPSSHGMEYALKLFV